MLLAAGQLGGIVAEPGRQPDPCQNVTGCARRISMARRALAECLADELHRLDPDEIYAETLTRGLTMLSPRQGESPS